MSLPNATVWMVLAGLATAVGGRQSHLQESSR